MYGRAQDIFNAKALEEHQRLLPLLSSPAVCSRPISLARALRMILSKAGRGGSVEAARLRSSFGIDARHFCYIQIQVLAFRRDWSGLADFANSRRPPVGFLPFVEVCQRYNAPASVHSVFLEKVTAAGGIGTRPPLLSFAKRFF